MVSLVGVRGSASRRSVRSLCLLAGIVGLTGCSGLPSLPSFSSEPEVAQPVASNAQPSDKMRVSRPLLLTSLKPVIGFPPALQSQLTQNLNKSALRENVALLVDQSAPASINLQGYVTASRDKTSVKYTYVWHVLSENGTRLGQITGDEVGAINPQDNDAWSAFTPVMSERIADRAVAGLVTTVRPNANTGNVATAPAR